ncbi:MAG: transposase [Limnobacter sp.]|nr:MAG: transposase [Limnobacter sp.]
MDYFLEVIHVFVRRTLWGGTNFSENRKKLQGDHTPVGLRAALGRERVFLSEKVVRRIMKQGGLQVARPRKCRYASYVGEVSPAPYPKAL